MPSIYPKTVKELIKEFILSFVPPSGDGINASDRKPLTEGGYFIRQEMLSWFTKNYPKIKKGTINAHLIVMSTNAPSRIHHNLRPNGADDLLYQIDGSKYRLYVKQTDPPPIYKKEDAVSDDNIDDGEEESVETHQFAYENDLKNFLANNMQVIRSNLTVYQDDDISGIEFPVGGRFIDILAVEDKKDLVVIELKVSKGYDRAVGQLLRYMAWIEKNLAEPNQRVKGMIIARAITEDLRLAASRVKDIELFEYQLSISMKKIDR